MHAGDDVQLHRTAAINDEFRRKLRDGAEVLISNDVAAIGDAFVIRVLDAIAAIKPHEFRDSTNCVSERRSGLLKVDGVRCVFTIEYFQKGDPFCAPSDPSDEERTDRVMVVMLAEQR